MTGDSSRFRGQSGMRPSAEALDLVLAELARAEAKFSAFNSAHEGYAVLLEEVDELWEAVRMQPGPERNEQMRKEAIQVGAMALLFLKMLEAQEAERLAKKLAAWRDR